MAENIKNLIDIMSKLRDPDKGCPWDIKQDFHSLAPYTIEEAYEVVNAISEENFDNLQEELGDLLLQVIFLSQIAKEKDLFMLEDVIEGLSTKLVRRHPDIFDDESNFTVNTAEEREELWSQIKEQERKQKGKEHKRLLDNVPSNISALMRATKIQKTVSKVGFDWDDIESVFDKLEEEIFELKSAIKDGDDEEIVGELGDMLFTVAHLANHLKASPEVALTKTNNKFIRRFNHVEDGLKQKGTSFSESNLNEMDELWEDAKKLES